MPKEKNAKGRVIWDSIWTSNRLALCSYRAQLHYPRLYLLIDDHGCFEIDVPSIRGKVYPKLLNVVSCSHIVAYLNEYVASGLLFVWPLNNTEYGYFTGTEEGRLPPPTRRHQRHTPPPPEEKLKKYIKDYADIKNLPTKPYRVATNPCKTTTLYPNPNPNPNLYNTTSGAIFFQSEHDANFTVSKEESKVFCSTYGLTEEELLSELDRMSAWIFANPKRKKKNYKRFVNNWLNRERGSNGKHKGNGEKGDKPPKGDGHPYPIDVQ